MGEDGSKNDEREWWNKEKGENRKENM